MIPIKGDQNGVDPSSFKLPGFEVSWAGGFSWPLRSVYCFGSEDGRILFTDLSLTGGAGPYPVAPSEDAINGVAFSGSLIAASTRSEVVFLHAAYPVEDHSERAVFYGGAHGVTSTIDGMIVAPMGRRGILLMGPKQTGSQRVRIMKPSTEALNIYKLACFSSPDHGDILACAARRSGFLTMPLTEGGLPGFGRGSNLPDVDFVDIAALNVDGFPLAAVAMGLDCSIHFVRDLLGDRATTTLRYRDLVGQRAYRILCAEGHVFLLTNRGLYVFVDLASRFLTGVAIGQTESVRYVPIEAVDASLTFDRSLLIVTSDSVHLFKIDALTGGDRGRSEASQAMLQHDIGKVVIPVRSDSPWEQFDDSLWIQSEEVDLAMVG